MAKSLSNMMNNICGINRITPLRGFSLQGDLSRRASPYANDSQAFSLTNTAGNGEEVIRTIDLTKRFGSFTAVDHISFSVSKGEIFGFLGANGAGKTTAMRMLCGLSKPTSGKGFVAGYDIEKQ